jgi:glycosyltransferase involved in cell wall biosynthesis
MGGAETWLMELLRLWSRDSAVRMDFLVTSGGAGIFDDEARELGAKIRYVRYSRSRLAHFTKEFRRILREGRYDAIHDHQDFTSGWHFLLGTRTLPPIRVTHVHNPAYQIRNNYAVSAVRRITATLGRSFVARYASHITGTSRQLISEYGFDTKTFSGIPKGALYCGFDPSRFNGDPSEAKLSVCREFGWPTDVKIVLFAGRIDRSPDFGDPHNHKNSGFAVAVGIECARRDKRIRMILAGTPRENAVSILKQRVVEAGCSGRIVFAGIRKDVARLMLASDVLMFPSRGEGLGLVAVEAQAAGLPVLASDAVPRECIVVPHLVHFEQLESGEEAWAAALIKLAEKRSDIGDANRRVAASPFAIRHSARTLFELYSAGSLR